MTDRAMAALIRQEIVRQAGGFLASPERIDGVTCAVCAAPVDGYQVCVKCRAARTMFTDELADLVGAMTYARSDHQTGHVMRGYKAEPPQQQHRTIVNLLLADALLHHLDCASEIVGCAVSAWTTIPSLSSGRVGHPLPTMVRPFLPVIAEKGAVAAPDHQDERTVRPENFSFRSDLSRHHLLVIDDTWTSGGQAQSVAIAARRAGARAVTVLVVARWLDPEWPPTKAYMASRKGRLGPNFEVLQCPFVYGRCPEGVGGIESE